MTNTRIFLLGSTLLGAAFFLIYLAPGKYKDEQSAAPTASASSTFIKETSLPIAGNSEMETHHDEISSLKKQVAVLSVQVTQLRTELNTLKHTNTTNISSDTTKNSNNSTAFNDDPTARAEADSLHRQEMAVIQSAFNAEAQDSKWANNVSAQIRDTLDTNQVLQNNLRNVECRSKTCRLEFSNGEASLPSLLAQLAPSIPSMSSGQIDQVNDPSKTIVYLSAK